MRYQLVLQLGDSSKEGYNTMIELEEVLIDEIGNLGDVDGHDCGSGTTNIFIHTDNPKSAFTRIQNLPAVKALLPRLRVAYRDMEGEEFTILHPPGLADFAVV